jgi:HNH endonuclease
MNPNYPLVSARALDKCEYCRVPQGIIGVDFDVDHVTPKARGGTTTEDNLALACRSCNQYKSDHVRAVDELTGQEVSLFNPRLDEWHEHFSFVEETFEIKGLTAVGRATVSRLRINSVRQVEARKLWLRLKEYKHQFKAGG